jgi:PiT family inorganic phosphate transporter
MAPPATARYDWILAITTITFFFSAFGNGANDVANSYATSVAARTLTMLQVGFLATITEFVGAVALGSRVTDTIKNGIIDIGRFEGRPGVLMLAMGCAEMGNAIWLMTATALGFPVSTTQTIVGSLIGVGFATQASITWNWESGSVSQIAASWGIAPGIAAGFAAIIFSTLKFGILERQESFKWAMRLIPFYLAFTAAILALFLAVEIPGTPDLGEIAGTIAGSVLGVFFGVLIVAYVFFMPYFKRKLIKQDPRLRVWHIPLGPLLNKDDPPLYFPGKGEEFVTNYYEDAYGNVTAGRKDEERGKTFDGKTYDDVPETTTQDTEKAGNIATSGETSVLDGRENGNGKEHKTSDIATHKKKKQPEPYERWIVPVQQLSWANPKKWWNWFKFLLLRGVFTDCVTHDSLLLKEIHAKAKRYDVRVEHLWTYCQVISAMMMSIAHGSNDVANAVGPWVAVYQ